MALAIQPKCAIAIGSDPEATIRCLCNSIGREPVAIGWSVGSRTAQCQPRTFHSAVDTVSGRGYAGGQERLQKPETRQRLGAALRFTVCGQHGWRAQSGVIPSAHALPQTASVDIGVEAECAPNTLNSYQHKNISANTATQSCQYASAHLTLNHWQVDT